MSEKIKELFFEYSKGQAQFSYFLLGVAASSIAFAIHQTSGQSLDDAPWQYAVAGLLWAISFACGCFGLRKRLHGIAVNADYIAATSEVPESYRTPNIQSAIDKFQSAVQSVMDQSIWWFSKQMWLLFFGAMFFIAGHIVEMSRL